MILKQLLKATLFIAINALTTGLNAENVYKCGDTYSQKPCPGASTVQVDDGRDPAQKKQTDMAIRTDEKLAQSMEKERLMQEKQNLAAHKPITPEAVARVSASPPPLTKITPKKLKKKAKKPEDFVAQVPGTQKKVVLKKTTKKAAIAPL